MFPMSFVAENIATNIIFSLLLNKSVKILKIF